MIEVTFNELKKLKDKNALAKNELYCVIDYKPGYMGINYSMAQHQFDIIVRAITSNKLSKEVKFRRHEGDNYFYRNNLDLWYGEIDPDFNPIYIFTISNKIDDKLYSTYLKLKPEKMIVDDKVYNTYRTIGDNIYPSALFSLDYPLTDKSILIKNDGEPFEYDFLNVTREPDRIVITSLTDEYNNTCNYDFKNVFFNPMLSGSGNTFGYTFGECKDSTLKGTTTFHKVIRDI